MSLSQIRINGIRLNSGLSHLFQLHVAGDTESGIPLYQHLAREGINVSCLGLRTDAMGTSVFCCHENAPIKPDVKPDVQSDIQSGQNYSDLPEKLFPDASSNVCTISVYPHNSSMNTLGVLIELFGKNQIGFQQMTSSNAMITFVVDRAYQKNILELLEEKFDLPPTHTPFQQDFNDETAAFVKKRYPETRATYVEEKIKTYGIQTITGLEMFEISFNPNIADHLMICGRALQTLAGLEKKFYFTAALGRGRDENRLFCLTDPVTDPETDPMTDPVTDPMTDPMTDPLKYQEIQSLFSQLKAAGEIDIFQSVSVDLVNFHGPHFGDRFGIFNTAMRCLKDTSIDVLLAGCTGASICMVLPVNQGKNAVAALGKGFETP